MFVFNVPPIYIQQPVSLMTAQLIEQCPDLVLGSHHLFIWDRTHRQILLSPSFQAFLTLLIEWGTLKPIGKLHSLDDLNRTLQQAQGEGGLLRQPGSERWDMSDHELWQQEQQLFNEWFTKLGFVQPNELSQPISVDHCLIAGATVSRMQFRIRETVKLLENHQLRTEKIYLLGSKRSLTSEELQTIHSKIEGLVDQQRKNHWKEIFTTTSEATEANAFALLWELYAPSLQEKTIPIHSTRWGFSYQENRGHRTTTDITTDDWTAYFEEGRPQAIFCLAEQPYIRLCDQIRVSVLTQSKRATGRQILERLSQTTFYFLAPAPSTPPLIGVVLDEIARNVYLTRDLLRYLEQLSSH